MLNNEKTIRFEDFAAVSQDGGDVLGKVLYYSLSSILIDRDELESLCDAVGFPKGRSNRTAMGDAFRSATGDIYERRVVKTDSGPQIFKVYCRDNKGGNASVISRELVKETVHEDTNEYRKLANITFNKTSKLFSYDNLVSDPFIDPFRTVWRRRGFLNSTRTAPAGGRLKPYWRTMWTLCRPSK